ncbi:hypothetical protein ANN_26266 [Periplaneta americana]|uniref:DUF4817 domain-containing protein n=1 Tax=Periplaneta americana TaxID=6978 RepID=A0ABQ8S5T5_PERAM|nr:hypothetical protein ANN_26266 [Periplaneta americana]
MAAQKFTLQHYLVECYLITKNCGTVRRRFATQFLCVPIPHRTAIDTTLGSIEIYRPCAAMVTRCSWSTCCTSSQHDPQLPHKINDDWVSCICQKKRTTEDSAVPEECCGSKFTRSPVKSTRQASCESGLSRYVVREVLKKDRAFGSGNLIMCKNYHWRTMLY